MNISAILLNYNNEKDTLDCVRSIKNKCTLDIYIIVVDNNSSEESKRKLKVNEKDYKLILNNDNKGFANGNNIGIKYALENSADLILLLNNDTIVTEGSIENLVKFITEENAFGIVSSRIMYFDAPEKIWYCGGEIDWIKCMPVHFNIGKKYNNKINLKEVGFVSGCCMLIKRNVFEKVGLLPEEYFMYYEDVDYCQQVINSGFKLGICPSSVIYHKVSSSSGGENSAFSIKWTTRNKLIFMNKYLDNKLILISKLFFYGTNFVRYVRFIINGERKKSQSILEGTKLGREYCKNYLNKSSNDL